MDPALVECDSEVVEVNHHTNHEQLVSACHLKMPVYIVLPVNFRT